METPRSQSPNQPLSSSSTMSQDEARRTNDRMHEAVDRASETAAQAEQRARQVADEARHKVRQGAQQARQKSEEMSASLQRYIRDNPMMALGVAFAAGTVIASLGRRH